MQGTIHPQGTWIVAELAPRSLTSQSDHQIDGHWTSNVWPVVISVYKQGETVNAIPLDQVMLRQNENRFRLWTPARVQYEIRVFNSDGELDASVETDSNPISVRLGSRS